MTKFLGGRRVAAGAAAALLLVAGMPMLFAPARAAAPVLLNTGGNGWLEATAIPKDTSGESLTVTALVQHDPGVQIDGLAIDDNWDGSDNTLSVGLRTGTVQKPAGTFNYSRVTLTWTPPNQPGFSCGFLSGTRRVANPLRMRAHTSDGQYTGVVAATVRSVENNQCTGVDDFPYIMNQSQNTTSIAPGGSVTFTFSGDDVDSDNSWDGINWRVRRLNDGAITQAATTTFGGSDNASRSLTVSGSTPFPTRGRYVVEAEARSSGGTPDGGWYYRLGAVDVNGSSSTITGSLSPSASEVNSGQAVTFNLTAGDSDGAIQMVEWDADNNGSFERRDLGTPGLAGGAFAQSITTSGFGTRTVRAQVTDNGAMNGADTVRQTKIFTGSTYVNGVPIANGQSVASPEDVSLPITLTASDPDGHALTYTILSNPAHGTLSGSAPNLSYLPAANYFGSDSFTFRVSDAPHPGVSNTATVNITVNPVNDPPVAADAELATGEDTPVSFSLGATDVDDANLTYTISDGPDHGSVTGGSGPLRTYTPAPDYNGTDSLTFTVDDGNGGSDTATVSFAIAPVNDAPVAGDQAVTTAEDTALAITLTGSDVEGDALAFAVSGGPAHGSLTGSGENLTYTPDADFHGTDSFTFTVDDGNGPDTGTVDITVLPVNDAPVADAQSLSTDEDVALPIALTATDVDGDTLTYSVTAMPVHGALSGSGTSLLYTPDPNYHGLDSFEFSVDDGSGGTATATVALAVNSVNDAPVADAQSVSTDEDTELGITLTASDVDGDALSFSVTSGPDHGTLTALGQQLTYTPAPDFNGADLVEFSVDDGNGGTGTAAVTITVNPVNDAPVAQSDSLATDEDTPIAITLVATDVDGDALSYSIDAAPAHGAISGAGANVVYTPEADFHGGDSFAFLVDDGNGGTDAATVTISVAAVNDAPVADPQSVATDEDVAVPITLTGTDVDGDALVYTVTSGPGHGSLTGTAPDLLYSPDPDFNGADSLDFSVADGNGGSAEASVTISVAPVNDAPVAEAQSLATNEDEPVGIVLGATDVDGDPLSYSVTSDPAHGSLSGIAPNLTYVPDDDFHGTDGFDFTVDDGNGGTSGSTISIAVNPVNDPAVAHDGTAATDEDTPVAITLAGSDVDGDALAFSVVEPPAHGTLSGVAPDLTYIPDADYHGSDSLTFSVDDGNGADTAVVDITVAPVNDAPVAAGQHVVTDEDTALDITLEADDVDGDAVTFSVVEGPSHGTVSGAGASLSYTPDADFNGVDSFTFVADDGNGGTGTAAVSIAVNSINDAPVAASGSVATDEDTAIDIVLGATDVDGDSLTYTVTDGPTFGTLTGTGAELTYTPNVNFNGSDGFAFTVTDGNGGTDGNSVGITVLPVNDAPTADAQSVATDEDTPVLVTLTGSDVDGDTISFSVTDGPAHGTLSGTAPSLTYLPAADYHGPDAFEFSVDDGNGGVGSGAVSLTVAPVNDAPVAAAQSVATDEDTAVAVTLGGSDVDGDTLAFTVIAPPSSGTLTGTAPDLTYSPDANFSGSDGFSFEVSDGNGATDIGTVAIDVGAVNDAPVAHNQSLDTDEEAAVGIMLTGADVEGTELTFAVTRDPGHGTLSGDAPELTYTPATDFFGTDSFDFSVTDGDGATSTGTISITVGAVNDAPVAADQSMATAEDTAAAVTLAATDADGDALSYSVADAPLHGALSGAGANLTYTPDPDFNGTDSFTFLVDDGNGGQATGTVTLTVEPVNDAPAALSQSVSTGEDTSVAITLAAIDVDGDDVSFAVTSGPAHGSLSGTGPDLTYTPDPDFTGTDSFTFTVSDPSGATDTGTVAITVIAAPLVVTNVEADPAVARITPSPQVYLTLSATLTRSDTGEALAGRTIAFSAGGDDVCTATTAADGSASCGGLVETVVAVAGLGYQARFDGDADFAPSAGTGPIVTA